LIDIIYTRDGSFCVQKLGGVYFEACAKAMLLLIEPDGAGYRPTFQREKTAENCRDLQKNAYLCGHKVVATIVKWQTLSECITI
jgi:hypothetical protein